MQHKFELIFEDDDIIIVNKPAGMLTVPDRFGNSTDSLGDHLTKRFGKIFIVHRLDRDTTGIICFAKNAEAHRHLSMQFEKHTADKFYLALLDGVVHHEDGVIDKPIGDHPGIPGKMTVIRTGKPSLTFYRVLERFRHFTLVEALIKTGRTHQVRVHFQNIGYALAVDPLYGSRQAIFLSEIKIKRFKMGKFTEEERPLMSRVSLHSYRLRLQHPRTEETIEFTAEPPKDFNALLTQLRKWGV